MMLENLKFIDDSNKGFIKAINKGNIELAKVYLIDIVDRTITLINQNEELECLGSETIIKYTETDDSTTVVTFDIYSQYRDFLFELDNLLI